jgi:hypothetical protein
VGADGGGVEDQDVQIRVPKGRQDGVPAPLLGPPVEPSPLAVGVPEPLGQVLPRDAGAGDIKDGVDESPVVAGDPTVLPRLAGQQALDPVPVGVRNRVSWQHARPSVAGKHGRLLPTTPTLCPYGLAYRLEFHDAVRLIKAEVGPEPVLNTFTKQLIGYGV